MIVKRYWSRRIGICYKYNYMGIFLFGFIPLYIERSNIR